jgi:multidrug efflux pump subunit AcrB
MDKKSANIQRHRYERKRLGFSGRIAARFLESKLTPLLVVFSFFLGLLAVTITPREEEPQIIVPMIDVFVQAPGLSSAEVEQRMTTPIEKLLWEIPGVEHLYSMSRPGLSMVIARFDVGQNEEDSLVKVYNKLHGNADRIPMGVSGPLIKLRTIDDVPVLSVALHSRQYDPFMLRQVAGEVATELKKLEDVSEVTLIGGQRRQVRVQIDPAKLEGRMISPLQVYQALARDNSNLPAGSFDRAGENFLVEVGDFFRDAQAVGRTVVAVYNDSPVYLADIATVTDGPEEVTDYVLFRGGLDSENTIAQGDWPFAEEAAVTIAVAKRRGANATWLTEQLRQRIDALKGTVLVSGIETTITRDYGVTAQEKSNELIFHMGLATIAVIILMGLFLGLREAAVVAVAVPVTLALTLFTSYFFGYTLNRVTLFALIFAIGILVDDAIVVVENIHRHFRMKWADLSTMAPYAVDEVGNPTILATFTVIFALMPMAFVTGLMGPYMGPIPINASAAMFFSLIVAFVVTPWMANLLLRYFPGKSHGDEQHDDGDTRVGRFYRSMMVPLITRPKLRWGALGAVVVVLILSLGLFSIRGAKVKMLPHDNKSEFQVVIDTKEGTTLEQTAALARDITDRLAKESVVKDLQVYVGTSGPINFNGLVRHYFLRQGPNVADIQVNLLEKHDRSEKSHEIARRLRPEIKAIADRYDAVAIVAEVPPGPPVWSTMLAEIYGPNLEGQRTLAGQVRDVFEQAEGVVDVDLWVENPQAEHKLTVDKAKAALSGITTEQITNTLGLALHGKGAGLLHTELDREPVELMVRVPQAMRSSIDDLARIKVHAKDGRLVSIQELASIEMTEQDPFIYHKDLRRVVYVSGEVAGKDESPVYGILDTKDIVAGLTAPDGASPTMLFNGMPGSEKGYTVKWDGEWQITYEVFRDMGIAFAVVMVLIYILVVAWFKSFVTPIVIMAPIPLTLIGIVPGHWLTGTYFTATSMIGFIALAGIVVRNSILLVDFIEQEIASGIELSEAVMKAGAIRFRPIVLTAAALVIGGAVILLDPIFSGLAVSLIFGVTISTALTLVVIPLMYYMVRRHSLPNLAQDNKEEAA